jgi:hypothetical protein
LWRMGSLCSSAETQVCHRSYIIAANMNWNLVGSIYGRSSKQPVKIYRSFAITGNYGRQSFSKYGISYYDAYYGWCKHSRLKSPNMVSTIIKP